MLSKGVKMNRLGFMRCCEVTWASMPALLRTAVVSARMVRLIPQTRARGQFADKKLVEARWVPTRDDEHAVSMLTLGPWKASAPTPQADMHKDPLCMEKFRTG